MPVCLSLQSLVVSGHVGHGASAFVLAAGGIEVWPLPTVVLSGHAATPGVEGRALPGDEIAALGRGLEAAGALGRVDAVLTGYLGSVGAGVAVVELVSAVRAANPDALVLCDPVMGDGGRLYLPEEMIALYRERLLPLADIATPNTHELGWLTDTAPETLEEVAAAADALHPRGPQTVFVTSVLRGGETGILASTASGSSLAMAARTPGHFHGGGDFTAALLLADTLSGRRPETAAARATAAAAALAREAATLGRDDLPVIAAQRSWQAAAFNAPPAKPFDHKGDFR